ncbi:MAG: winged helix-turn-helix domain-containing protein [Saccharolobus sp.]
MNNKKTLLLLIILILLHITIFSIKGKHYIDKCPFLSQSFILLISGNELPRDIISSKSKYNLLKILELLVESNTALELEFISYKLNISRKITKKYLEKLEKCGLVEIIDKKYYTLTEAGKLLINDIKSKGF